MQIVRTQFRHHKNEASVQNLHCLPTGISMLITVKVKTFTKTPKARNGLIQMIKMKKVVNKSAKDCGGSIDNFGFTFSNFFYNALVLDLLELSYYNKWFRPMLFLQ